MLAAAQREAEESHDTASLSANPMRQSTHGADKSRSFQHFVQHEAMLSSGSSPPLSPLVIALCSALISSHRGATCSLTGSTLRRGSVPVSRVTVGIVLFTVARSFLHRGY